MERKIGETFEFEGKWLKVKEEDAKNACRNCYLVAKECSRYLSIIGECLDKKRSDNKNIVFEDITYKPDKNRQQEEQQQEQAEQPQELNLCEILKDCPKGTKLYSTVLGYVIFQGIVEGAVYPIVVSCENGVNEDFTADGKMFIDFDGECTLFPSKEQRRWADFIAPWLKKERFDPKTLKPFDKVLVRSENIFNWNCSLFSNIDDFSSKYPFSCLSMCYRFCIPYNDETKHLVGTKDEAPDFYRYWEE